MYHVGCFYTYNKISVCSVEEEQLSLPHMINCVLNLSYLTHKNTSIILIIVIYIPVKPFLGQKIFLELNKKNDNTIKKIC